MNSFLMYVAMYLASIVIILISLKVLLLSIMEVVYTSADIYQRIKDAIKDRKEQKEIDEQIKNAADIAIAEFERRKK